MRKWTLQAYWNTPFMFWTPHLRFDRIRSSGGFCLTFDWGYLLVSLKSWRG